MQFTINGQTEIDLGELPLRVYTDPTLAYARKVKALQKRNSESESESRTKLFGQIAPNWISIDGTGLDHRANIEACYSIQGLGDYLLIDPDGRVTRGDLGTLQKILDGK